MTVVTFRRREKVARPLGLNLITKDRDLGGKTPVNNFFVNYKVG